MDRSRQYHIKRRYDNRKELEVSKVGHFSVDTAFHDDDRQMKFVQEKLTPQKWDLNNGYEDFCRRTQNDEIYEYLFHWILSHTDQVYTLETPVHFVCFTSLLQKICTSFHNHWEDWIICATRFNDVIYLREFDTKKQLDKRKQNKAGSLQDKMSYWGSKFEQYITSGTPEEPVNQNPGFHLVIKTKIGRKNSHTLIYKAEVDAKDPKHQDISPNSTQGYVEIKTVEKKENGIICWRKLLSWWLQCALGGIPRIICGFRDENGIVNEVKNFELDKLQEMGLRSSTYHQSTSYCWEILNFIKKCVNEDHPHVYKFEHKESVKVVSCEKFSSKEYEFLPDWYMNGINNHFEKVRDKGATGGGDVSPPRL